MGWLLWSASEQAGDGEPTTALAVGDHHSSFLGGLMPGASGMAGAAGGAMMGQAPGGMTGMAMAGAGVPGAPKGMAGMPGGSGVGAMAMAGKMPKAPGGAAGMAAMAAKAKAGGAAGMKGMAAMGSKLPPGGGGAQAVATGQTGPGAQVAPGVPEQTIPSPGGQRLPGSREPATQAAPAVSRLRGSSKKRRELVCGELPSNDPEDDSGRITCGILMYRDKRTGAPYIIPLYTEPKLPRPPIAKRKGLVCGVSAGADGQADGQITCGVPMHKDPKTGAPYIVPLFTHPGPKANALANRPIVIVTNKDASAASATHLREEAMELLRRFLDTSPAAGFDAKSTHYPVPGGSGGAQATGTANVPASPGGTTASFI